MSRSPKAPTSAVLHYHKISHKRGFQRHTERSYQYSNVDWRSEILREAERCLPGVQKFSKNAHSGHTKLDVNTRWNSTFHMIQKAYKARPVLDAMCARDYDLCDMAFADSEWNVAYVISDLLQFAAKCTENQSGQSYVTLSVTVTYAGISNVLRQIKVSCGTSAQKC